MVFHLGGPTSVALLATLPCFQVNPPLLLSLTLAGIGRRCGGGWLFGAMLSIYAFLVNFIFFHFYGSLMIFISSPIIV